MNITDDGVSDSPEGGSKGGSMWLLGVTFGLLGSIAINTGNNIQSMGLMALERERAAKVKALRASGVIPDSGDDSSGASPIDRNSSVSSECDTARLNDRPSSSSSAPAAAGPNEPDAFEKAVPPINAPHSKVWILGTCTFLTGSFLNFASFAFAAQSLLASLESIQFVTNILFGRFMLKAKVTRKMYIGTGTTVVGTILAVQFSSKATMKFDVSELRGLYQNPLWITYLVVNVGAIICINVLYEMYATRLKAGKPMPHTQIVMPIMYSVWSALFGTQSVVQAKVIAVLLASNGDGEANIFKNWFTYMTIGLWLTTVSVWLYRLNAALSRFNPMFIIPLLQCNFIFFAIVSGGIFFREFESFSGGQWVGFTIGIATMFAGLVMLVPKNSSTESEAKKREGDLASGIKSGDTEEFEKPTSRNESGDREEASKRAPWDIFTGGDKKKSNDIIGDDGLLYDSDDDVFENGAFSSPPPPTTSPKGYEARSTSPKLGRSPSMSPFDVLGPNGGGALRRMGSSLGNIAVSAVGGTGTPSVDSREGTAGQFVDLVEVGIERFADGVGSLAEYVHGQNQPGSGEEVSSQVKVALTHILGMENIAVDDKPAAGSRVTGGSRRMSLAHAMTLAHLEQEEDFEKIERRERRKHDKFLAQAIKKEKEDGKSGKTMGGDDDDVDFV